MGSGKLYIFTVVCHSRNSKWHIMVCRHAMTDPESSLLVLMRVYCSGCKRPVSGSRKPRRTGKAVKSAGYNRVAYPYERRCDIIVYSVLCYVGSNAPRIRVRRCLLVCVSVWTWSCAWPSLYRSISFCLWHETRGIMHITTQSYRLVQIHGYIGIGLHNVHARAYRPTYFVRT